MFTTIVECKSECLEWHTYSARNTIEPIMNDRSIGHKNMPLVF